MRITEIEIIADDGKYVARKSHCKYNEDYFTKGGILDGETLDDFVEVANRPTEQVRLLDEKKEAKIKELEAYNNSEAVNAFSINGQIMPWMDYNMRSVAHNTCNALSDLGGFLGLKCNLDLSHCPLAHDSIINVINGLFNVSANPKTLTLGASNLAKISDKEIQQATNKGWILN